MSVLMGPRKRSAVRPQTRRPGIPRAFMSRRRVRDVEGDTPMMLLAKELSWRGERGWVRKCMLTRVCFWAKGGKRTYVKVGKVDGP